MSPWIWDAIVIGAGPAGAVTARQLALKKFKVLLVDKSAFPRAKVCGCCMSRRTLSLLAEAGFPEWAREETAPFLTRFHAGYGGKKLTLPIPPGRALARLDLDAELVEGAVKAGTEFMPRSRSVIGDLREGFREVRIHNEGREEIARARVVVSACGLSGSSLTGVKHDVKISRQGRFGAAAILEDESSFYEPGVIFMACGTEGYAGLVRLEDGRLNIAAALNAGTSGTAAEGFLSEKVSRILQSAGFPVPEHFAKAVWSGTPALTRTRKSLGGERYFIIGDAAGYSEPFTGEGVGWAVESALSLSGLAVESIKAWKPGHTAAWQRWHRKHMGRRQRLSRFLAWGLRQNFVLKSGFALLARYPQIARPFVSAAAGRNIYETAAG